MFVGYASQYATSIWNILNLKTKHISPQFHVMHDDWYTTTNRDDTVPLDTWEHLFLHHHEQVPISPMDTTHLELTEEWLDPKELLLCHQREQCDTLPTLYQRPQLPYQ